MSNPLRPDLVLCQVFLALLLVSSHASAQTSGESKKARPAVLFTVGCGYECQLEPIALISQGRFLLPVRARAESFEEDMNRFLATYVKKDRPYNVFFRGSRVGRVRTREGSFEFAIEVTAKPDAPLPFQEKGVGLATDARGVTGHPRSPPADPSPEQMKQVTQLARKLLKKQGVPAKSLQKMESTSLWVAQLDNTSEKRILASFTLEEDSRVYHSLMLIARTTPAELIPEFTSYQQSASGEEQQHEFFLDHLDLDGDGVDEIVTRTYYWEAWQYQIYKRTNGTWERVYAGGGGST